MLGVGSSQYCLLRMPVLRSLHANTWHAAKLVLHAQVCESTVGIISLLLKLPYFFASAVYCFPKTNIPRCL